MRRSALTRWQAWVDIALLVTATVFAALAVAGLVGVLFESDPMALVIVLQGSVILVVLGVLLRWRGQRWRDIGLRRLQAVDPLHGLLVLLACVAANVALTTTMMVVAPRWLERHAHNLVAVGERLDAGLPFALLAVLIGFVGFYEELTARGLLLSRCLTALPGRTGPIIVSSLLFGLGHAYQGWLGVVQTTLIGIVLAHYTLRWGSLWPAIIAHASLDLGSLAVIRYAVERGVLLVG